MSGSLNILQLLEVEQGAYRRMRTIGFEQQFKKFNVKNEIIPFQLLGRSSRQRLNESVPNGPHCNSSHQEKHF